jgi:DNA recombination protein RmuC
MEIALGVLAAALFGASLWLWRARDQARAERDLAQARLADAERNEVRLKDSFSALAQDALKPAVENLTRLSGESLRANQAEAAKDFERRKAEVEKLVQPLGQALVETRKQLESLGGGQSQLQGRLQTMAQQSEALRAETSKLAQALSRPNVRGRYGEVQLRRVIELAGMREWCDFSEQATLTSDDERRQRPDVLVKLPNGRLVAVDAKVNIEAYVDAIQATDEVQRAQCLARFGKAVVEQAVALGKKDYWARLGLNPEFVVMFVPGDQFVDAALAERPELIELAASSNVVIASPSTLIGLLRAIHVGWREQRLYQSAAELFQLGKELLERSRIALDHANRVGERLGQAVKAYNEFTGSVDSRLMPTLRKFEDVGAVGAEQRIEDLRPVEIAPRQPTALPEPAPSTSADD